jgi:hypothetical protein
METTDKTTWIYSQACEYASGVTHNVKIGAMLVIMRECIWKKGWIDQVHGTLIKTPTLTTFIEQRMPKGIGQSIAWTYAALKAGRDLGDRDAEEAIALLNSQIEREQGKTAEAIYKSEVAEAIAPSQEHGTNRHSRDYNVMSRPQGNAAAYTIARLKRDYPKLAKKVVSGVMSANAAAIEAGFRKQPTALDRLRKDWKAATAKQRTQFLAEIRGNNNDKRKVKR